MRPIPALLKSATFRLAALYTVLFTVSVVGLLGFVHYATAGYLARQTDAAIAEETAELANRFRAGGVFALAREITNKSTANGGGRSVYLLADEQLDPIAGNIGRWPEKVTSNTEGWIEFRLGGGDGGAPVRARVFRPGGRLHLLIGRNVSEQQAFRRLIIGATGWGLLLSLALAVAGGLLMSRTIARRLERINRTAREVMGGDLQRRIPTTGADDEFERLTQSLNRMLDQIQHLMDGVRQVSDNIAHDLRTPLTRLRWRLDNLREDGRHRPELLDQAIADAEGLLNTFHALLRIAEVESGSRKRFAHVDAASLVRDVGELYEPVAGSRDQQLAINVDAAVQLRGDRDLLFQALTNLVDNAVKYAPAGSTVEVRAGQHDGHAEHHRRPAPPRRALRLALARRRARDDPARRGPRAGPRGLAAPD